MIVLLSTLIPRFMIALTGAALLVASVGSPASAVTADYAVTINTEGYNRGMMHFIDDGDQFQLCDQRADGYGVTGYLQFLYSDGVWRTNFTMTDGGDSGCGYKTQDIKAEYGYSYRMKVCWSGNGACKTVRIQE